MGRPRKPAALQTGHISKQEKTRKAEESAAATTTRKCFRSVPADLIDDVSKKEWRRISKMLSEMQIIGDLDASNLIGYCNAYSLYVKATKELSGQPLTIETEKGIFKNPLVNIQDVYAKQLRDFAAKAGLSIDARLKCAALKIQKEDTGEITDVFGDI